MRQVKVGAGPRLRIFLGLGGAEQLPGAPPGPPRELPRHPGLHAPLLLQGHSVGPRGKEIGGFWEVFRCFGSPGDGCGAGGALDQARQVRAAVSFTDRAIVSFWISFLASRWSSLSDAPLTGALLVFVYSRAARTLFHTNPHAFCFRRQWVVPNSAAIRPKRDSGSLHSQCSPIPCTLSDNIPLQHVLYRLRNDCARFSSSKYTPLFRPTFSTELVQAIKNMVL